MSEQINKVGVVGLGVMGFDIAFLYAMKGFQTFVYDAAKAARDSVNNRREQTLERLQRSKRISDEETERVRKLLVPVPDLAGLAKTNRQLQDQPLVAPELLSAMAGARQAFYSDGQVNSWLLAYRERTATDARL